MLMPGHWNACICNQFKHFDIKSHCSNIFLDDQRRSRFRGFRSVCMALGNVAKVRDGVLISQGEAKESIRLVFSYRSDPNFKYFN